MTAALSSGVRSSPVTDTNDQASIRGEIVFTFVLLLLLVIAVLLIANLIGAINVFG